jgi:cobalt-zinc-cadmium efflux system membrane fusion protein
MARSQAELPVAQANAQRLTQLAREGVIAPSRAEEAVANLRAVQATLAENRRLLALGGASRDGTVTLRSPIAGRVASVGVETGGAVSTEGAPFVVENVAALRLDLQLPQRLAGQLYPGMPVAVEQDGRRVTGKLLSVGASLDPVSRSLVARASVAGDSGLIPGKGVTAIIEAPAEKAKGVSVPRNAVANIDGKDVVFVREGKNFRRQTVTVAGERRAHGDRGRPERQCPGGHQRRGRTQSHFYRGLSHVAQTGRTGAGRPACRSGAGSGVGRGRGVVLSQPAD